MYDPLPIDRLGIALRYLAAALPLLLLSLLLIARPWRPMSPGEVQSVLTDVALGVLALVLMRWRRRWPWPIALATAVLTVYSFSAIGAALACFGSLAMNRTWRQWVPVGLAFWLCVVGSTRWKGTDQMTITYGVAGVGTLVGAALLALYLRGRRDLAAVQREAEQAAQRQRVEQAQLEERLKIAQEMHDVLAHRISLLAMLAGGLAYRTDLSAEQTRETALAIQENAHQSLNELRAVLGTLRRDGGMEAPQPTLAHLDALFEEVRAAGQQVEVDDVIDGRELLPTQIGRHAYRIVQEALTNARKHAPGSRVQAELGGRPGEGLRIRVSNPAPSGAPAGPGGRLGLVGLAERTRMAGGTITHSVDGGRFVLDARLPWEA
ncbi:sensor histidine kinase [Nonomuraea sp. NPDC049400]|uniref:sensor histidine kinase n=1 Tax=Nonomuraea sp. NPDC049400 TaxID=3364352 RepID=UPI0037A46BEF